MKGTWLNDIPIDEWQFYPITSAALIEHQRQHKMKRLRQLQRARTNREMRRMLRLANELVSMTTELRGII